MNRTSILINGESIDYSLENEKTTGEVVERIAGWLGKSGMCIDSLLIDEHRPTDDQWRIAAFNHVRSLNVNAVSLRENTLNRLELTREYLLQLMNAYESNDRETLEGLSGSYPDFLQMLSSILGKDVSSDSVSALDIVFLENSSSEEKSDQASIKLADIGKLLESRHEEVAHPEKKAAGIAEELVKLSERLEDVAVQFQTGNDTSALGIIIHLTDLLQSFLRCMPWMEVHERTEEIYRELSGFFAELEEALKTHDTVLIGDLLEYEIKSRLIDIRNSLFADGEARL